MIKLNTMESDEGGKQGKISNIVSFFRNIFQSNGLRCLIEMADGRNRELLVFNFYFLPIVSVILYLIFLIS